MGDYIVQADIEQQVSAELVIQLTDDSGAGVVNTVNLNQVIDGAEGQANGYLEGNYSVPLYPVPPGLKVAVLDITVYRLYLRRGAVPEQIDRQYQNAVGFLRDVSRGVASLGASTPAPGTTSNSVDFQSDDRKYTDETLGGF